MYHAIEHAHDDPPADAAAAIVGHHEEENGEAALLVHPADSHLLSPAPVEGWHAAAAATGSAAPGPAAAPPAARHWLVARSTEPPEEESLGARCAAVLTAGWDDRSRTTALVNCAAIVERVDEQLLPALYRFVGKSFRATPSGLGVLTLSRALVQALASPLAGVLGHYVNRILVLTLGAALWGLMTALFSTCHSIKQAVPYWALNGVGLSMLIPTAQSIVADYNVAAHRGKAFGVLHMTGAVGALLGTLYATNVGGLRVLGIEGWRFAFLTVAATSWAMGLATCLLGVDPRYTSDGRYRVEKATDVAEASVRETVREVWEVLTIPSFLIIITQGIVGSTPWNALVFATFYFQLLGFSDLQASVLLAAFLAANAVGGLLGGFLGDWAAQRWPDHGRIVVCQISVAVGVPLSFLLFKGLPLSAGPWSMAAYILALVVTGLLITWADSACNNPIFAIIVPTHMRNLIYSFDRSFEGAIAALGAPLVGWLAEKAFGFKGTAETSGDVAADLRKARSLGNALLVFTALPWALCALFFSGLHWTYPRDRRRAEELALAMHPARVELAELVGESEGEDEEWGLAAGDGGKGERRGPAGGGGNSSPEAEPRLEDSAALSGG